MWQAGCSPASSQLAAVAATCRTPSPGARTRSRTSLSELLIGESADPKVRLSAYDVPVSSEQVVAVKGLLTMQLGACAILVAARVEFDGGLLARELEGGSRQRG